MNDADVVCRQLDCGSALEAYNSSQYGHGAGPVRLTGVECLGNESALHHCNRPPTEHLKLRLVGRGGHCSGRVEVYYNGSWGTVCDDQWDLSDAEVVCKQLGCGHAITATTLAVFGEGKDPVWLDDMQCRGNESLLWECPLVEWGRHNCKHREDAGVVCSEFKELKLVSDRHDCAGRVEVFYNGTWGSVCSNNMRDVTIGVICQQMGCGNTGTLDKQFGEEGSGPKWLDSINCLGYESVLWQCPSLPWGQNKCVQGEVAQIACQAHKERHVVQTESPCSGRLFEKSCTEHMEVRLAGGDSECSGRVEVRYNGSWGTVCDESWDLNAASVVCQQLDCGSAVAVVSDAGFGEGIGPVWLDEVHCRGSESLLIHCELFGGVRDCGHKEDAGVVCSGPIVSTPATVRHDAAVTSALLVICGSLAVIVCVYSSIFTVQFYRKRQGKGGKSKASAGISDAIYQEIDPSDVVQTLENFPVPDLESKDSVSELDDYNEDALEEISLGLPSDQENTSDVQEDSFITLTGSLISRAEVIAMYSKALENERETSEGTTDYKKPRTGAVFGMYSFGAVLNQYVNRERSVVSGTKNSEYDDVECPASDTQSPPGHGHSDYDDVVNVPLNGSTTDKCAAVLNQYVNRERSLFSGMKNSEYDDIECLTSDNQSPPEHGHSNYDDVEDVPLNGRTTDKAVTDYVNIADTPQE
ncbi:antigen WC1.1 [Latimeria chalumnae]|uniref:antigen WC1.1 n=1 Tax=Latimeria chalumnae TaxID=7897 RepID=UPI00313F1EAC